MNIDTTGGADPRRVIAARDRNDRFRRSLGASTLMLSAGVIALGAANQARIISAIQALDAFDDDDPGDLHDIGDVEVELVEPGVARWRELIFFKIIRTPAPMPAEPCPSEPSPTRLALLVMLASEW